MAETVKKISESGNIRNIKSCRALPFRYEALKQLRDFGVFEGGIATLSGTPPFVWSAEKQKKEFSILWFVLRGHVVIENGSGGRVEGREGNLLLRPSSEKQRIISHQEEFEHIYFKLEPMHNPVMAVQPSVNAEELRSLMEMFWTEYTIRRRNFNEVLHHLCGLIVALLERNLSGDVSSGRTEKLFRLLEEHPGEIWSVQRLARAMNMSTSLLYKLCRQDYGKGPAKLIQKVKMLQADSLLCTGEGTLDEIAASLGYSSAFAFSKVYTNYYGKRPGQVRRERK